MDAGPLNGDHTGVSVIAKLECFIYSNVLSIRLCSDADLMRRVWENYDSKEGSSNLFGSLVSVLKRLVTEKPALLGVSSQMFGVGVSSHHSESGAAAGSSGYGFDVGTVAGLVANAASATVTGVVGMMGSEHGLSLASSSMKLQW